MPQEGLEQREAEGSRTGAIGRGKSAEVAEARKGGRPPGSKNKSKSLIPTELADKILLSMEGNLPSEHLEYMRDVVKRGGVVSTKRELDVLIVLLNRNLWPALIVESAPDKEGKPQTVFRKDVTERLKVLNSLLSLRNQIDKGEKEVNNDGAQPLLQIFGSRAISDRIGILVGLPADTVPRNTDGTGRSAVQIGAISNQTPERQEPVQDSIEVEADWVLDGDSG